MTEDEPTYPDEAYRLAAQRRTDDELEIDDTAVVSRGCGTGAYVQAWIWIDNTELEETHD